MMKIKSFFVGILLLMIVFIMLIFTALVYRANERSGIKTYFFQMGNNANQRIGELQNINDISQNELRNKLIKKYVSEYFKVIPGDANVTERSILKSLSTNDVFYQWKEDEAKNITDMSNKNMFRIAKVQDGGIKLVTNSDDVDYKTSVVAEKFYYEIHYDTLTWTQSNIMKAEPIYSQGVIYMEARFKPGINPNINIKKYLEEDKNPVELFMFEVTNIGSKGIR